MILTLVNLPNDIKYSDIRELVHSKCGIQDIILDNLLSHENRTKKVTIGLAGDADAAIFMRKINGLRFRGHELKVVSKNKQQTSNIPRQQPDIPSLMENTGQGFMSQNFGSQGQNFRPPVPGFGSQGQNYGSSGQNYGSSGQNYGSSGQNYDYQEQNYNYQGNFSSQGSSSFMSNTPTMVPAPDNYSSTSNSNMQAYQSAYYLMNQPAYQPNPSVPNVGYNIGYGNAINPNNQQNWSGNNRNTQAQNFLGFQNITSEDQGSQGSPNWSKNRGNDYERRSGRDNAPATPWDDSRRSRRDNNRQSEPGDNRESNRNRSGPSWDKNRDSRRQSNNDAPRGRDSGFNRNNDNYSRSSSRKMDEGPSRDSYDRGSHQGQSNRGSNYPSNDHWRDSNESPAAKRPRFSEGPGRSDAFKPKPLFGGGDRPYQNESKEYQEQIARGKMWRSQLTSMLARRMLADKSFVYTGVDPGLLHDELQIAIRARIDDCFKRDHSTPIKVMQKIYFAKYDRTSNWILLRDTLRKLGGELVSKLKEGNTTQRSSTLTYQRLRGAALCGVPYPIKQVIPKHPNKKVKKQKAPLISGNFGTVFGNIKVDRRFGNNAPNQQQQQNQQQPGGGNRPPNGNQQKQQPSGPNPGNNRPARYYTRSQPPPAKFKQAKKPKNAPVNLAPGQKHPQGDKFLFKQAKKQEKEMFTNEDYLTNIMNNLNPGVKKAVHEEVDAIIKMMTEECADTTGDKKVEMFCEKLKKKLPKSMKKILKINLTKRIIPLHPIQIRVFASKHVKKPALEAMLKQHKITCLNKATRDPYYVGICESVEQHDKLCLLETLNCDGHMIKIKTFHMAGFKDKQIKNKVFEQRKKLIQNQDEFSSQLLGLSNKDQKGDIQVKEEELKQEIDNLTDEILDPNTENQDGVKDENDEYESPIKSNDNVDDMVDNINEQTGQECLPVIEDTLGDRQPEGDEEAQDESEGEEYGDNLIDNIDIEDVNDEDLEDW